MTKTTVTSGKFTPPPNPIWFGTLHSTLTNRLVGPLLYSKDDGKTWQEVKGTGEPLPFDDIQIEITDKDD